MKKTASLISLGIVWVLLNTACTSGWRAPLETRGANTTKPVTPITQPSLIASNSYVVKTGDTLHSIAWRSDQDFLQLAKWNNIRQPYTIYAGQRLRLTAPEKIAPVKKPAPSKKPPKESVKKTIPKPKPSVSNSHKLAWRWPTKGRIVATYKANDRLRKGIKIAGALGQTITAAEAGRVVYSGSGLIGYGRLIIIKHNDQYLSAYGHNQKLLVQEGQQVNKGSKIAELGRANDGRALLHFEIRRKGKPVNPLGLLPKQ